MSHRHNVVYNREGECLFHYTVRYTVPQGIDALRHSISCHEVKRLIGIQIVICFSHMLRKLRDEGAVNFLVACSRDNVLKFLKHAQMVGMIIQKYSYFITSLVSSR